MQLVHSFNHLLLTPKLCMPKQLQNLPILSITQIFSHIDSAPHFFILLSIDRGCSTHNQWTLRFQGLKFYLSSSFTLQISALNFTVGTATLSHNSLFTPKFTFVTLQICLTALKDFSPSPTLIFPSSRGPPFTQKEPSNHLKERL